MHANYASNNRKRDNVKIKRIALDLHDVIVDSKKVVLFECEFQTSLKFWDKSLHPENYSCVPAPSPFMQTLLSRAVQSLIKLTQG